MPDPAPSIRVYRWLLKLYPARFREEYARVMEREFRDEAGEAKGFWAAVFLWTRMLVDLSTSIPAQIAREVWEDAKHLSALGQAADADEPCYIGPGSRDRSNSRYFCYGQCPPT